MLLKCSANLFGDGTVMSNICCLLFILSSATHGAEYCQWETFQASCPQPDHVILMTSARYGRMNFSRCVRENHGKVGCYADVVAILHGRCSGRKSCRSSVPNGELHRSLKDCPKELMPYLEAEFVCVKASFWTHNDKLVKPNSINNENLCASPSSSSSSSTFSSSSSSSWTSSLSETTTSASSNPPYTITDNNKNNNNNNNNINNNNKHNQHLIFSKRKDDKTSGNVDSKQLNVDGGLVIPFPSPSQPASSSSSIPSSSSSSQLFDASRNEMNFCSWKIEVAAGQHINLGGFVFVRPRKQQHHFYQQQHFYPKQHQQQQLQSYFQTKQQHERQDEKYKSNINTIVKTNISSSNNNTKNYMKLRDNYDDDDDDDDFSAEFIKNNHCLLKLSLSEQKPGTHGHETKMLFCHNNIIDIIDRNYNNNNTNNNDKRIISSSSSPNNINANNMKVKNSYFYHYSSEHVVVLSKNYNQRNRQRQQQQQQPQQQQQQNLFIPLFRSQTNKLVVRISTYKLHHSQNTNTINSLKPSLSSSLKSSSSSSSRSPPPNADKNKDQGDENDGEDDDDDDESGDDGDENRILLLYEAVNCPHLLNLTYAVVSRRDSGYTGDKDKKDDGGDDVHHGGDGGDEESYKEGEWIVVTCLHGPGKFRLNCQQRVWVGDTINCPVEGSYSSLKGSHIYAYGVLTAIGLAVALCVSCLVVATFSFLAFFKRRSSNSSSNKSRNSGNDNIFSNNSFQDPLLQHVSCSLATKHQHYLQHHQQVRQQHHAADIQTYDPLKDLISHENFDCVAACCDLRTCNLQHCRPSSSNILAQHQQQHCNTLPQQPTHLQQINQNTATLNSPSVFCQQQPTLHQQHPENKPHRVSIHGQHLFHKSSPPAANIENLNTLTSCCQINSTNCQNDCCCCFCNIDNNYFNNGNDVNNNINDGDSSNENINRCNINSNNFINNINSNSNGHDLNNVDTTRHSQIFYSTFQRKCNSSKFINVHSNNTYDDDIKRNCTTNNNNNNNNALSNSFANLNNSTNNNNHSTTNHPTQTKLIKNQSNEFISLDLIKD